MKTEIDWNIFCECVNCMSIHPKGGDSVNEQNDHGIELPVRYDMWAGAVITASGAKIYCDAEYIATCINSHADLLAQLETVKAQLAEAEIEDKPKSIKQKIKDLDAKLIAEGVTAIMHSTRDDVTYNRLCEVLRGQEYRYDLGDEATVDEVLRALIRERNALLAKS